MSAVEETGRTVEEAVDRALAALWVSKDDVEVEVLEMGARGMLGLGARAARVRVTLKQGGATLARALAERFFHAMGYTTSISVTRRDGVIFVEVRGPHLGPLIGKHGGTLDAIEVLLGLMTTKRAGEKVKIHLDVEGYRERRQRMLEDLARRTADRVLRERREVSLDPMDARERRIIHTVLAGHPHVLTHSQGEGAMRRVVIAPRVAEMPSLRAPTENQPSEG